MRLGLEPLGVKIRIVEFNEDLFQQSRYFHAFREPVVVLATPASTGTTVRSLSALAKEHSFHVAVATM